MANHIVLTAKEILPASPGKEKPLLVYGILISSAKQSVGQVMVFG